MIVQLKKFGRRSQDIYMDLIDPLSKVLARTRIHPHVLTVAGFVLSLMAANFFRTGRFLWAGIFIILAGTCDILDGRLARDTGKGSRYGALFDSTVDRYSEIFIFLGLTWFYYDYSRSTVLVILLAVAGSMMVSYTRARAEGLGLECRVGILQRQHRITLLVAGAILGSIPGTRHAAMLIAIWIIAILANVTAVQRVAYIRRQLTQRNNDRLTTTTSQKETVDEQQG
jgi:CDP-diacylglycerol--glycerol-3-phosphate 3-phosphatidyltransferase